MEVHHAFADVDGEAQHKPEVEERRPLVLVARMQSVHGSALLHDVRSQRPLAILIWFVAIDDHESGPIKMAVILEQLFLSSSLVHVMGNILLIRVEQSVTVNIFVGLSLSE